MGIEPDIEYGCDCAQCWGPGKTPKYLLVVMQGVMKGSAVLPPRPPPPNGHFIITQKAYPDCCIWDDWFNGTHVYLRYTLGTSGIIVNLPGLMTAFTASGDACDFWFANDLQDPDAFYYGGFCQVVQVEPEDCAPSLLDLAELINLDYSGPVRAEFGPCTDGDLWAMYADTRDGTRIHIKKTPT